MKTLSNHLILYDAECPMCRMYTRSFVNSGMLEANGREAYQHMPAAICPLVDRQRAANEIALVNTDTGEVTYGVSSLFKVIGHSLPLLKPVFNNGIFLWLVGKVYAFISYNRRVIIPGSVQDGFGVQPAFRLTYRLLYLIVTWIAVGSLLTGYAHLLAGVVPAGSALREYLICGGQILFQGIVVSVAAPSRRWDYLGNMMTISFAGALLLSPVLVMAHWLQPSAVGSTIYFMLVAGLMFLEHVRRSKLLGLGWVLTCSWVIYRLLVLGLIYLMA